MLDGHVEGASATMRLAATLSRAAGDRDASPTKHATAILRLARNLRAHLTARKRDHYRRDLAKLKALALVYGADVIDHRDLNGMVVGFRFPDNSGHRSGHPANWYYLA